MRKHHLYPIVPFPHFVSTLTLLTLSVQAGAQMAPTFNKDVAPILFDNCVTCHRQGEIGPMSFWDNSAANPHNPDPGVQVQFGPEIMMGYFEYTLDAQDLAGDRLLSRK